MIELLSPVGDFECLKSAVQSGADAVYLGASTFSARAFASNFDDESLEKAINYAKLREVKTNLTLNTLIKNSEMQDAINLAKKAYEFGIDAIIVQDLGLANYLIKNFPGLAVHASTQLSVHNLEGVLALQKMGFSRVVLSRELPISEIEYICKNSDVEIEVFVHGALCISYSGQCLFSSMVGGRSGNRGKCAQPCRLPYELIENNTIIDKGYLLSPRDLCGLDYLPQLISSGITCLKIEGRMKTPEYVSTVTRIYRKYIDLIESDKDFEISNQDRNDLLQVFNRGGFSSGHLAETPNKNLIYKNKSNNMGIFLGTISNFNSNKGYISFKTTNKVNIGDKISIENKKKETSTYTISELMINNKNVVQASEGDNIKIGRMKGQISMGDKIYKISDKYLTSTALNFINKESRKICLDCKVIIKKELPISIEISDNNGISINIVSDSYPVDAINSPITKERVIEQISKTNNTPFQFKNIEVDLDNGLYLEKISVLNELRRKVLSQYEERKINSFKRSTCNIDNIFSSQKESSLHNNKKISILLNIINNDFDYTLLDNIDRIYIPFKYFVLKDYSSTLKQISNHFNTYIYLPTITRNNYKSLIEKNIYHITSTYNIKGFVISNLGHFELLQNYRNNYEFICNYTFNVFNDLTASELPVDILTLSPELNKSDLQEFKTLKNTELIVYGNTPLMNSNYCLLGKTNKCYSSCKHYCINEPNKKYYLKDRLGFYFRIIPDNIDTVTTIYNSKITFIEHKDINVNSVRIDILDETISDINNIIHCVKNGQKIEGKAFTNGNLSKEI